MGSESNFRRADFVCLKLRFENSTLTPNYGLSSSFGGAERDRTADPLLAKQVLSQLSYSPSLSGTLQTKAGRQIDQTAYARFRVAQYTFSPCQFR
jgi:hypothetical protein